MKLPSALGKMRAGSLNPGLYGEISEFLSSVKPDFSINGKTSLLIVCRRLQEARAARISAKRMKDAERMIRAICAAAEIRGIQYGRAGPAAQHDARALPGRIAAAERFPMREGIAGTGLASRSVPKEILAERKRVADAAEKAGMLPPDLDYRNTDLRHMAIRLGLEK